MLEKGKISAFQLGILMYPTIIATAIFALPGITAKYAMNDLWLSPIWASLVGFLTVHIVFRLHRFYPKQTIIQYSKHILGWIPGKALGFVYVFFYLHFTGLLVREYAEFVVGSFLSETPISLVIGSMVLVCAFAVRGGLEVIGRANMLFFPILVLTIIALLLLLLPEMDPKNIFPLMEHGIMPSITGAIIPQGWFSDFFILSFFLPFLTDVEKGRKWGMISALSIMLTMVFANLVPLFLFGETIDGYTYPLISAVGYVQIADFFENLESFVMAIWILGAFVKVSVFYYATVLGTAQWLHLSDYRPIVLPLGFLAVLFSFWSLPSFVELSHFFTFAFEFYVLLIQTLIPLLLLLIAVIRNRKASDIKVEFNQPKQRINGN